VEVPLNLVHRLDGRDVANLLEELIQLITDFCVGQVWIDNWRCVRRSLHLNVIEHDQTRHEFSRASCADLRNGIIR
jgi:hypothetical protein